MSVAIVSKSKTLLARQFVEMSRIRIEGILSTFPKLLGSGKDHTFIETETVRYVYQPIEQLYLVVVTNKSSIIMEDLETLKLLVKVAQETCSQTLTEDIVRNKAFDLVFAFDEVVSFGYRENVTMAQINSYIEMDSHEEKLARMIEAGKLNVAKEEAKKKAMELRKQKGGAEKTMEGIGNPAFAATPSAVTEDISAELRQLQQQQSVQQVMAAVPAQSSWVLEEERQPTHVAKVGKKGLSLGAKKTFPDQLGGMMGLDANLTEGATSEDAP